MTMGLDNSKIFHPSPQGLLKILTLKVKAIRKTSNAMTHTALVFLLLAVPYVRCTPLDDYVYRDDPTYKYEILETFQGPGYTLYNINMTSQTWKPGKCAHTCVSIICEFDNDSFFHLM